MVALTSLWLPILVAAILVFIVSSLIHMVLGYHHTDYKPVPREDEVMAALRPFNLAAGDYFLPRPASPKQMNEPAYKAKLAKGPIVIMSVLPPPKGMGLQLAQWFVFSAVVALFSAYVASRTLGSTAAYLDVFRVVGTTAFMGYSLALWPMTIWYKRSLSTTLKSTFDGLVYALLTAGACGWLWPR